MTLQHRSRPVSLAATRSPVALALPLLLLALAGCSESRPAPGAEACVGGTTPLALQQGYGSIGLPASEPDLEAWVVKEQAGLAAVTTQPCVANPPTHLLRVPPDAKLVQLGREASAATLAAGQRIRVWYEGGSSGTARAILIERAVPWPPPAKR